MSKAKFNVGDSVYFVSCNENEPPRILKEEILSVTLERYDEIYYMMSGRHRRIEEGVFASREELLDYLDHSYYNY